MDTKGITFIELILVIALIATIGAAATPFLSRFVLQANFDSVVDKTTASLRKAQSYAMDSRGGLDWGVCVNNGYIRLYGGTCAAPDIFEDYTIPSSVGVSGLDDVVFDMRAQPSQSAAITISTTIESTTVNINAAGGIITN